MSNTAEARGAAYYLGLRYPVSITELPPEEGGGYVAAIPQLGEATFNAHGETVNEAYANLDELRRDLIPRLVARGVEIPEPRTDNQSIDDYSGRLMLRIPKGLHAKLASAAEQNDCSLNKLATQLLSGNLEKFDLLSQARDLVAELRAATMPQPTAQTWGPVQRQDLTDSTWPRPETVDARYDRAA